MIDIHSHLLPAIDDGSPDWDKSILLAQQAVADGITHALMTPHHHNGKYRNPRQKVEELTSQFQAKLDEAQVPLKVFPSQEIRINGDLVDEIAQGSILGTDEELTYLLLELPDNAVPNYTNDMVFKLLQLGITPIIVHPERNTALMAKPNILYDLIDHGAFAQVTASSLVGTFGKKVEAFTKDIIKHGLAHVIASDAHYLPGRDYEMQLAFAKLNKLFGDDLAHDFESNARNIVNGDKVITRDISEIKKHRFFGKY